MQKTDHTYQILELTCHVVFNIVYVEDMISNLLKVFFTTRCVTRMLNMSVGFS